MDTARTPTPIPDAPHALPIIGHALVLARDPLRFLRTLPVTEDIVRIRVGTRHAYLVCTPALTREVLVNDAIFDKGGALVDRAREVLGNGVATCPHAVHRRQRRLVQPAFHPSRLPGYGRTMARQITSVTDTWHSGRSIDVLHDMQTITSRVLAATLFTDGTFTHTRLDRIMGDLNTFQEGFFRRMLTPPALDRLPVLGNRRHERAMARLRSTLADVIADHRADGTDRGDVLSALLTARDPDNPAQGLGNAELVDQMVTFCFGGTETTACLLAWALYLVARHPHVERALHREVDRVLRGRPAQPQDAPHLDLTSRVVQETLRTHPPVYFVTRETTRPTRLAGHPIPRGTTIVYSPYVIHHRPDVHPRPERFDPDRWLPPQPGHRAPRDTLVHFAAGARKCAGDDFALLEATLALATITARWRLTPTPTTRVRPKPGLVLAPQGLRMTVTARHTAGDDGDGDGHDDAGR
ncbi:cytochrome P450 (plasmid) [Streptomyces sp. BI20]|uniref:cytochrome P450 n=1 Tax=Streptomyces sp. BI20 TaxID=3403460 RepID=UPI003C76FE16